MVFLNFFLNTSRIRLTEEQLRSWIFSKKFWKKSVNSRVFAKIVSPQIFLWTILNHFSVLRKKPNVGLKVLFNFEVQDCFTKNRLSKKWCRGRVEVSSEETSPQFVFKMWKHRLFLTFLQMVLPHIFLQENESWLFRLVAKCFVQSLKKISF